MDLKDFKAGNLRKQLGFRSFMPELVDLEWIISDPRLNTLLAEANRLLGELNALSLYVPDVDFFITMHVTKEATESSRIEGTQTNIEEALLRIEALEPERRADWEEVRNYIDAINFAIDELVRLPLSNRLLRATHAILLRGVRGQHKMPGEFRTSQNWIGPSLAAATFVPPAQQEVPELMGDLENFLNNDDIQVPDLVRIAIAHYQFETIHPFLDGNGRLGRLLITLFLVSNKLLARPTLYLSDFFEQNRLQYFDLLTAVRTQNRLQEWVSFFLTGVVETSRKGITTFQQILRLKEDAESRILLLGKRTSLARQLLRYLYSQPLVTANEVAAVLEVSSPTANVLIQELVRINILHELTGYKRNRIFSFTAYVRLFKRQADLLLEDAAGL
jgi:Fic family protein